MKHAIVPIHQLMHEWESIITECEAGVYVGRVTQGLVDTVRLIRYENKTVSEKRGVGGSLASNPRVS